jgi:hypothetical protein
MRTKHKILVFLLCLMIAGCHQSGKTVIEAEFDIDRSLLSESSFISPTGFSIYPPRDWTRTINYDAELENIIMSQSGNNLLAVFKHDSTNCALIVSEVPGGDFNSMKQFYERLDTEKENKQVEAKIQTSVFKYKSFDIIQIVSQNTAMINFKLYVHRLSEIYELDYIIPRNEIDLNVRLIESSIGSLN